TPLIRLLLDCGACVTVRDCKTRIELGALADAFPGAALVLGDKYLENLDEEIIFKTPGMRPDVPELNAARVRGSCVTSEMEVFFRICPSKIIGVTGSDGKTTTTTIIYEMLKAAGVNAFVGGNIGAPLLDRAGEMTDSDVCVLELSSFQLMTMDVSPDVAVITNIAPNHLDMHTSMDEYIDAKRNVYKHNKNARVVLNYDNKITRELARDVASPVFFSRIEELSHGFCVRGGMICNGATPILDVHDIKIPGAHNVENYLAAIAALDGMVPNDVIVYVARTFGGVAHRMEHVRSFRGAEYYNDSIASSPTRTIAGLRSFQCPVILIAGGYDKNIPFDVLGPEIIAHVKALVLVGATASKIRDCVVNAAGYNPDVLPIIECETFKNAVNTAASLARAGDVVTLSPACASFDLFKNFAERGDAFRRLVNELCEE
ncbi:MAG: UDP-N-acetylmuramoyl-L-alanine--D-glutamate ligase, partial [Clostridia bacterium]